MKIDYVKPQRMIGVMVMKVVLGTSYREDLEVNEYNLILLCWLSDVNVFIRTHNRKERKGKKKMKEKKKKRNRTHVRLDRDNEQKRGEKSKRKRKKTRQNNKQTE